jgi:hypothetical protein
MADLLRFKDILEMDGQENPLDRPKLSFDDLHVTQYRPGEDELTNYRAYRRKRVQGAGSGEGGPIGESTDVEEALTVQQRLARKRMFKRIQPRIRLGREKAKRRIASKEKLMKRARKQVRMQFFKKFTKDIPKDELTYARRAEIEKRLDKPAIKRRIDMLTKRMFPKTRKAELEKKRGGLAKK